MRYTDILHPKQTPQGLPAPGTVPNSAGGHGFAVDDWTRLHRFLILGSEGGTYYASERALTVENAAAVARCAKADGPEAVRRVAAVSASGRAPKNDPAVFALALIAAEGDAKTKSAAYAAVPAVCRTGTHLFQFAAASDALRGWGRGLRGAVANWYLGKSPRDLAYQVAKYQRRDGWGHRDLLRLAHPKAADAETQAVLRWAACGADLGPRTVSRKRGDAPTAVAYPAVGAELPAPIRALEAAKRAESAAEVARLIRDERLVRECVPTKFLDAPEVWDALLADMPVTALLRNLATLTRVGVVAPGSDGLRKVVAELGDAERLKRGRVHPLAVLIALRTYASGRGVRGSKTWAPVPAVVEALDRAFYAAFAAVEPTGKRWMLALDVSGSMGCGTVAGAPGLTPREASAALALVTAATEPDHSIVAFTAASNGYGGQWGGGESGLTPVPFAKGTRLDRAVAATAALPMGGTDCALPVLHAERNRLAVDVFVVLTDSETWAGKVHPFQALRRYREKTGIPAKLAVVGMVSNGFSIADPSDAGMLDVVGFDAAAPALLADFARN